MHTDTLNEGDRIHVICPLTGDDYVGTYVGVFIGCTPDWLQSEMAGKPYIVIIQDNGCECGIPLEDATRVFHT